jgi:hypothetical protein
VPVGVVLVEDLEAMQDKSRGRQGSLEDDKGHGGVESPLPNAEERVTLAETVRRLTLPRPQSNSSDLVREDRDRR